MEASKRQSRNASSLIKVTELGIETEASDLQFIKAFLPIEVTEFGIVTEVRPVFS